MSKFLHDTDDNNTKAIAIPQVFSENSRAKKMREARSSVINLAITIPRFISATMKLYTCCSGKWDEMYLFNSLPHCPDF